MRDVTLVIRTSGHESVRTMRAGEPPMTIGRDPASHLAVTDDRVSWAHAWLWMNDTGEVWVRDLGSRNGTGVDHARVQGQQRVPTGSTVQIATALEIEVRLAATAAVDPVDAWFLDDLGSGLRVQVIDGTHPLEVPGVATVTLTRRSNGWWLLGPGLAIPVEPGHPFGAGPRTYVLNHVDGEPPRTVGIDTSVS